MSPIRRHELTDDQWAHLQPLLPLPRPRTGRAAHDHRTILNGILWILRTGAPWRDLPTGMGHGRPSPAASAGLWDDLLRIMQREAAFEDDLDGSLVMIDGTSVRAYHQAAGARTKGT
jgi:transposase